MKETPKLQVHVHKTDNSHTCDRCAHALAYSNDVLSERLSIWTTASNLLLNRTFEGGNEPSPDNILDLAVFLAGENS
jgi:hypothetical protein